MLMDTVNRFAPVGHRPVPTGASRGGRQSAFAASAFAKQEQEDAQDFLHYLLDQVHLVSGMSAIRMSMTIWQVERRMIKG